MPPAVPISPMMASTMSLARDAFGQRAIDGNAHVLRLRLDQRLRGEHMLDLRRADAKRQRAEGAMRRGVAVAADDRHAGLRDALLGSDNVHDALADIAFVEIFDAEFRGVGRELLDLHAAFGVVNALGTVRRRDVWSTTASVLPGARTRRPPRRRPSKACGSSPRGQGGDRRK